VKALDSPHIGHVVRETSDKIVVFGEGDDRYDIPKSAIRFAAANVLIDLPFHEIVKNYKVRREEPLPLDKEHMHNEDLPEAVDLATYEGKYPKSLFNKGVRPLQLALRRPKVKDYCCWQKRYSWNELQRYIQL
jgi:hypothetical protein